MRIGRGRNISDMGKWVFTLDIQKDHIHMDRGWNLFWFGYFKLIKEPELGSKITRDMYKGMIIRFYFWFPIELI